MNIVKLSASNVMRMEAFSIEPTSNTVVITGKNGQGKSSVLNTILFGLAGKDSYKLVPKPVREGADEATIKIQLGDKYTVDVYMTKDNVRYLHVYGADGKEFKSPQTLLDNLIGDLTIDPSEIIGMKPKDIKELLLKIINLDINLDEWSKVREDIYNERTAVGREHKSLAAQLEALPVPNADLPDKEILMAAITQRYQEAVDNNTKIENLKNATVTRNSMIDNAREQILKLEADIKTWEAENKEREAQLALMSTIDTTPIKAEMDEAEAKNIKIRERAGYFKFEEQVTRLVATYQGLSTQIDNMDKEKYDALARANMPVAGLGIEVDEVTYNGIPFTQCSDAERLKIAMAMAMAKNPEVKVILLRNGSMLDSGNFELIKQIAEEREYQLWIEKVEESGKVGVFIEDGKIKAINDSWSSDVKAMQDVVAEAAIINSGITADDASKALTQLAGQGSLLDE